ncbi:unnamed protein product [Caenorhabditis sp. 36 PRJEB53466]|nr:unnamed protein product [Caenorhabditis sp. 36 PRJEB53466]
MSEVKKIVQATLSSKPEDEPQVIEKCLNLVGSNRAARDRDLGFLLLSRMIIKCSPGTLRAVQSRLANRFAQISDHFQLSGSLFVREVLIRNPQAGELHSPIVFKIILNCLDAAVESGDQTIRGLSAELFALRISTQNFTLLLNTLNILLNTDKKNVSSEILQLRTLGVTAHRVSLTSLLFEVLALSLGYATKPGLFIDRKDAIRVIELGVHSPPIRSVAFACLRSLCVNSKYSLIPMIGRIVSTLVAELETPDVDLIKTLAFISNAFGPVTSTLHKHFYVIFTALKHPLHEQDYGEHVGSLLSTIIESSAALIKPEVFVTVQKAVCESAVMHVNCPIYHQLLAAFLALNNEFVPSPLQIARSICSRSSSRSEHSHRLRVLCDVASRPRTTDLANVKAKKTLIITEEKTIRSDVAVSDKNTDLNEEKEEEKEEMEVEEIPKEESPTREPKDESVSRKKKNSESSTPVVPKKKRIVREVKTDLLEGEASVDDILNLFDPS